MRDHVGGVAAGAAEVHRHATVGIGGQDEQQLLEVRAVVARVAVGDGRGLALAHAAATGGAVLAAQRDRGRVVVQLLQAHAEALSHRQYDLGEQRGAVGVEQPIERAPDAVVAQAIGLRGIDAEQPSGKAGRALLLAVDRLALDDDRAQQHAKCLRVGDGAAAVGGGDVLLEQLEQTHARQEMVDQG